MSKNELIVFGSLELHVGQAFQPAISESAGWKACPTDWNTGEVLLGQYLGEGIFRWPCGKGLMIVLLSGGEGNVLLDIRDEVNDGFAFRAAGVEFQSLVERTRGFRELI